MISCTEFIPAYSELFKYIEEREGHKGVHDYWNYISDNYVKERLGALVSEKGIMGCWEYWNKSLNEEACDFTMSVDGQAGTFNIDMRWCPSKGRLLEYKHFAPYNNYCGHCDVLYRRVLEPLGFTCECDMSRTDKAACSVTITKNPISNAK